MKAMKGMKKCGRVVSWNHEVTKNAKKGSSPDSPRAHPRPARRRAARPPSRVALRRPSRRPARSGPVE
jgi:hypothetical protein